MQQAFAVRFREREKLVNIRSSRLTLKGAAAKAPTNTISTATKFPRMMKLVWSWIGLEISSEYGDRC